MMLMGKTEQREENLKTALELTSKSLNKLMDKRATMELEIESANLTIELIQTELAKLEK